MKKQIEGQINLFDYISAEDAKVDDKHDTIEISLFAACVS